MPLPDRIAARIGAFSLIGVVNGAVGVAVILLAQLLGAGPILANVLGYGAGLVVSFTLNQRITFGSRASDRLTVLRFLAAFAVAFAANLGVVWLAERALRSHGLVASLAGTPVYVVVFYLLCEYWVFRRRTSA